MTKYKKIGPETEVTDAGLRTGRYAMKTGRLAGIRSTLIMTKRKEYIGGVVSDKSTVGIEGREYFLPKDGLFSKVDVPKRAYLNGRVPVDGSVTGPRLGPPGKPREVKEAKVSITIRLDADVVRYFKVDGPLWQTRINDALRLWMERYSIIHEEV